MPEGGDSDKFRWLKDLFNFRRHRNTGGVQGTDGPTSPGESSLEPGQGINERPTLQSGASGGGTRPGVDPLKDTV